MSKNTIAAVILTYNEEIHIARCINSIKDLCNEIFVIDSYSTDHTCEIAESLGAFVYRNEWLGYSKQFNWALKECSIQSEWIWRIDADEYAGQTLQENLKEVLDNIKPTVNGISINRKIIFLGRPLMYGGWYPFKQLKIIRKGYGTCEELFQDEHLIVYSGEIIHVQGDITDENLNNLSWWIQKHNNYSTAEVINMLVFEYGLLSNNQTGLHSSTANIRRRLKSLYVKFPLFIRPLLNFLYRYIFLGGFLDGKQGLIWHFLQGFWYRFLVDAKIYEMKKQFNWDEGKIKQYIKDTYLRK